MLGIILGASLPRIINLLTSSLYDRVEIEGLMRELVGNRNISEAMTDELLLVAYEYNSQEPRLYSKYFSNKSEEHYDVLYSYATGGSSAAPGFFEPQLTYD